MTSLAFDPGSIASLSQAIGQGTLDPVQLLERCLARCDQIEPQVQAWVVLDREQARQQARQAAQALRAGQRLGPLHGIPVAIKDVIDVAGLPTRAGSRTRAGQPGAGADADIVAALRAAGAVIMGKVHTTEFAYFDGPPPTRNPWNLAHTPGGSSSGPAAAVAAGMVPVSVGTQTAGSVVRPAAYCGIAAFKPGTHTGSTFGVVPFAPAFDTVGWFGYRLADVAAVAHAVFAWRHAAPPAPARLRIGIVQDPLLDRAQADVRRDLEQAAQKLREAGHAVQFVAPVCDLAELAAHHLCMLEYEVGRVHRGLLDAPADQVTASLRAAIERGGAIDTSAYARARAGIMAAQLRVWQAWAGYDALLFPAAPGAAPAGTATGDPGFIVPFTALGGPIATIPTGWADTGLPLGMMAMAAPGADAALLQAALRIAGAIELDRAAAPA
ncbi:amidase [Orrella sp. JC864]|uniref:amidase n=1 Tax=Orrella sp. JC864 TaxID=3120298 RepID=UPI00300BE1C7